MAHMELFLLLPVYQEADGHPGYLRRTDALDNEEYRNMIEAIGRVSSFFCYEIFKGYYDSENLKGFMAPIDALTDCYPKLSVLVRKTMLAWGADWRRKKNITGDDEVRYFGETIRNDTMGEVAKRQMADNDSSFLIVDCNAFVHKLDKREIDLMRHAGHCIIMMLRMKASSSLSAKEPTSIMASISRRNR